MPERNTGPLYLIDGFSIIFRNYYAMRHSPLTNTRGENVSALLGFIKQVQQVLRHAQECGSQHVAMVLDSGSKTFRHAIYPEYKANRDEAPDDLVAQIAYLADLLMLWEIPTFKSPGYEADDLIAALAKRASAEGQVCYVVTGDKDLYQLIDEQIRIAKLDKGRMEIHGAEYVLEKWGIHPEQIRDYLAIVGDSADNIPGVKGIGPKGAAKLLATYQYLDNIYTHINEVLPEGMRRKLEESKDNAYLSYKLASLTEEIPELQEPAWAELWQNLAVPNRAYSGKNGQSNPKFSEFLENLGLYKLAIEFGADRSGSGAVQAARSETVKMGHESSSVESTENSLLAMQSLALTPPKLRRAEAAEKSGSETLQSIADGHSNAARNQRTATTVLQGYECIRTEAQLQKWCERISKQKLLAIDTETTGLNELADELVGISLATAKHEAAYIPLKSNMQEEPPLLTAALVRKALIACLNPEVKIIGQNFKFDYKVLANWELPVPNIYFDTMIAAWLLDSLHPVGMDALAERYLGIEPIHFSDLIPKAKKGEEQKTFADLPFDQVTQYAAEDADITLQLFETFLPMLQQQGLESLFWQLEMPLVQLLGDMELRGISCNKQELEDYASELQAELGTLEDTVKRCAGEDFNLNSTQQMARILFEKLELPAGKKTKSGYSTDNTTLEKLSKKHPVIAPVLEYRRLNKLYSTYVKSLPTMILPQTQRIHTHFSVIGAETGRLACRDPNLQNIPVKDAAGRRIRSAFQPRPGWGFLSADYSQIELVVLAHLSADSGLCKAFRSGRDIHQQTASQLFFVPLEQVNTEQRRIAKSINFGVIYGMSAFRLSQDLGLTRNDAQSFIDAYFREFSGVKSFIEQIVNLASEKGYVQTLAGRRREIRQLRSNNKNEQKHGERMAVNTVVQGSAADIVKQAMIRVSAELQAKAWQSQLLLQVHDELIFEVPSEEREQLQILVLDVMENAYELEVPLKVNSEWSSRSWGDLH